MIIIGVLVLIVCFALFVCFGFFKLGNQSQTMSPQLGVLDGRLRECPGSPNCVVSYPTDEQHYIEPVKGGETELKKIVAFLEKEPGFTVVSSSDTYLYVTFTSKIFGFVDDTEFLLVDDLIHVRSASRVGKSDLNANRKRVEGLRALIAN